MRSITRTERRSRLAHRHGLGRGLPHVVAAAESMVGLHSSDPATVYLAAKARVPGLRHRDVARALYADKCLVRMLGMRRTMFVVPQDLATVMNSACTQALFGPEKRRLVRLLEEEGITPDGAAWIDRVGTEVTQALDEFGPTTARELREVVPDLKLTITFGDGKKWGGKVGVSTRILFLLATSGRIIRAEPLGTWISSQYRWSTTEQWLGAELPLVDPRQARAELLTRWLASFGPGTEVDMKWWTGWSLRDVRAALADIDAVEVQLEEAAVGFVLPSDLDTESEPEPWVALLPGLDPTVMGWKERDWYLGDHAPELFDRNGNAGPTIWSNGRVVGGWAQLGSGEVAVEHLEDVGIETKTAIEAAAGDLEAWLSVTRLTPRFRTPLERRISNDGAAG